MIDKDNVLLRVVDGPKIVWDGNSYVEITVSSSFRKSMCGLCGNYNGNVDDDFQMNTDTTNAVEEPSPMIVTKNVNAFGQSWRVGKFCFEHISIRRRSTLCVALFYFRFLESV